MNNCKVSVIIPLYNGSKYIIQTLDSVLAQTYSDYEIVIVDDASTDNSYEVVERYIEEHSGVVFKLDKNSKNRGIAATRNRAIELSCGEYIALLDQDDIALPKRLELSADFLDNNPEFGAVGGGVCFIDEAGKAVLDRKYTVWKNPLYIKARIMFGNIFANCEMMFRKEICQKYQIKYRDNMCGIEDFAFWTELVNHTKMVALDEVFLLHRVHEANSTKMYKENYTNQRAKTYACVQRRAFRNRGFILSDEECEIIEKEFAEKTKRTITVDELKSLHKVLFSIVRQSREMRLEEVEEIEIVCKQMFSSRVRWLDTLFDNEI